MFGATQFNTLMKTTKFTCNWNKKLGCDFFTTLRLHNPEKYLPGNKHKILLQENGVWRDYGMAEVVSVRILRLHQFNEFICGLDSGCTVDETKNILYNLYKERLKDFNKAEFDLVLYRKEKMQNMQRKLLM
jgi:hypothetical protein